MDIKTSCRLTASPITTRGKQMSEIDDDRPRISDDVAKEVDIQNTVSNEFEQIARVIYAHSKYLCQSNALTIVKELNKKYYIIPRTDSPEKWVKLQWKQSDYFTTSVPDMKWRGQDKPK